MDILCLRSVTIVILVGFVQCFFCVENAWSHEGWGIVVDRQKQIYFSDIPTNSIWKITSGGNLEKVLSKHSHALVLGEDGGIYGTQEHHAAAVGNVWRIAPDGSFSDVFIPASNFTLSLHPFTIDRDGNIYSTNSISFPNQNYKTTLLKAKPNGDVTILAGGISGYKNGGAFEAQFSSIDGMAFAPDGSLFVTDGVYVRRVAMDGTVSTVGNGALTSQSYGEDLMGLTLSVSGNVYVADYSQRRVFELKPDGNTRPVLETGVFWSPTGVAFDGEDLYVLEHLRMPLVILGDIGVGPYTRVRKVSSSGNVETIVTVWGRNTLTFAIVLLTSGILFFLIWRFLVRRRKRNMQRSFVSLTE
jgi:sugar lactone lactonase YvrE